MSPNDWFTAEVGVYALYYNVCEVVDIAGGDSVQGLNLYRWEVCHGDEHHAPAPRIISSGFAEIALRRPEFQMLVVNDQPQDGPFWGIEVPYLGESVYNVELKPCLLTFSRRKHCLAVTHKNTRLKYGRFIWDPGKPPPPDLVMLAAQGMQEILKPHVTKVVFFH